MAIQVLVPLPEKVQHLLVLDFFCWAKGLKGRHQWGSAQRIKISMVAGGNHTIVESAHWCKN